MADVYVCYGKDCRKAKGFAGLRASLGTHRQVRCQKICDGPVAGVEINGTLMWFDKLRNAKRWSAFVQAVRTGSLPLLSRLRDW